MGAVRSSTVTRKTKETEIVLRLNLDGSGKADVRTGIGFFDHMLTLLARHGLMDLEIKCQGDLEVDTHHTIEDVGIVIGKAIAEAVGDKKSMKRFGTSILPMDESLAMVSMDISSRPYIVFEVAFTSEKIGDMQSEMVEEFFRALAFNSGITLHIKLFYGSNNHHIAEAIFKAFGRALNEATRLDDRIEGVLSTKGIL